MKNKKQIITIAILVLLSICSISAFALTGGNQKIQLLVKGDKAKTTEDAELQSVKTSNKASDNSATKQPAPKMDESLATIQKAISNTKTPNKGLLLGSINTNLNLYGELLYSAKRGKNAEKIKLYSDIISLLVDLQKKLNDDSKSTKEVWDTFQTNYPDLAANLIASI